MAKSKEPLVWSIFAGGGMVAAMLLPICIFLTGLLVPMGGLSEDQLYAKITHPIGKLILLVLIFLPLFHAAHRMKHTVHEMGLHLGAAGALIFYGGAFAGAGLAAFFLFLA
jgi:fumarate reductase subunit D